MALKEPAAIKKAKQKTNHRTRKQLAQAEKEKLLLPDELTGDLKTRKAKFNFFYQVMEENGLWFPNDAMSLNLYLDLVDQRDYLTSRIKKAKTDDDLRMKLTNERNTVIRAALEYEKQLCLTPLARAQLIRKSSEEKKKSKKDEAIDLM